MKGRCLQFNEGSVGKLREGRQVEVIAGLNFVNYNGGMRMMRSVGRGEWKSMTLSVLMKIKCEA